jgi:hypothetical protein
MNNATFYPEKERFGRFVLNLTELFEATELTKATFEECLKTLRDCNGRGWSKNAAMVYLITGKAKPVMHAYGTRGGRTYRRAV